MVVVVVMVAVVVVVVAVVVAAVAANGLGDSTRPCEWRLDNTMRGLGSVSSKAKQ